MKKNILSFLGSLILLAACDTAENNPVLPAEGFNYISFDKSSIEVGEDEEGAISIPFVLSAREVFDQDMTINYTITFPEERAAQEGVDFVLPSNSGSFILPAGQNTTEVLLLESLINDDQSTGPRSLTFNLDPFQDFVLGSPGNINAKSITITINEDDLFVFGFTSFEEVPTFDVVTRYPRPAESANPLPNIQDTDPLSDLPYVTFTDTTNELGFVASYSAGSVSEVENERLGVYNNTAMAIELENFGTTVIDGVQGYVTSDLDGQITLTFDEIVGLTPDVSGAVLEITFFFRDTSWEEGDGMVVFFETADGPGAPLLSVLDDAADAIGGEWQTRTIPIPEDRLATGRLIITMVNGAGSETIILDSISIKGIL